MRKLIETKQKYEVVCDNKLCDFKVLNTSGELSLDSKYLNVPCPKCGTNLLTEKDYNNFKKTVKIINFLNKWFSWLIIFSDMKNKVRGKIETHNQIKLTTYKNDTNQN